MRATGMVGIAAALGAIAAAGVVACHGKGGGAEVDASTDDASNEDGWGDDGSCTPQTVDASFAYIPPNAPVTVCTLTQIQTLYDACWGSNPQACDAFSADSTNSACIACMVTKSTAPSWGPLVAFPNQVTYPNGGGCMALLAADAGGSACAQAFEAAILCDDSSCAPECPSGSTSDGLTAYSQCVTQAETTTCAAQFTPEAQCATDSTYRACSFVDFQSSFVALGRIFCAGGFTADAGSDAPDDGD